MAGSGDRSEGDTFWDDVAADDVEIGTTVFVALLVLLAFSLGVIGFEWAIVAMLGLIAAASATK